MWTYVPSQTTALLGPNEMCYSHTNTRNVHTHFRKTHRHAAHGLHCSINMGSVKEWVHLHYRKKNLLFSLPLLWFSGHEDGMHFIHPSLESSGLEMSASSTVQWGWMDCGAHRITKKRTLKTLTSLKLTISLVEKSVLNHCFLVQTWNVSQAELV